MDNKKIPVIIDTDIGDDIDDAFAICLAVKSPELEILGITTVFKDTVRRAKIARKLLRLGGYSCIPVIPGCGIPIVNPVKFGKIQDYSRIPETYIDDIDNEDVETNDKALDFLCRTISSYPEPVTLITLGPLTNIGLFIATQRELARKIKRIVMMGGAFFMNYPEHNIASDPEAAQIVLDSGIPITAVGLDVTFQCKLDDSQIKAIEERNSPCLDFLIAMRRNWKHEVYLHDPLAVAVAFDSSFVSLEKHVYTVELHGQASRGIAVNLSDFNWGQNADNSSLEVSRTVKSKIFTDMVMERLLSFD